MKQTFDKSTFRQAKLLKQAEHDEEHRQRRLRRRLHLHPDFYEYTEQLRTNAKLLYEYFDKKAYFEGPAWEGVRLRRELRASDAPFMQANNPEARILFYPAWVQNILDWVDERQAYLVTLVPSEYVYPISTAKKDFKLKGLQEWVRKRLKDFDCVGIVEAAYYSRPFPNVKSEAHISFHAHVVVVTSKVKKLRACVKAIKGQIESLLTNCPSADLRKIRARDIARVGRYMIKEPTTDYRVFSIKDQLDELNRSKPKLEKPAKVKQNKKRLTSGVQWRLRKVTARWHLDEMVFGCGTGREVVKKIRYDALRHLPWSKRRGRELVHGGCFEPDPDAPIIDKFKGWLSPFRGFQFGDYRPNIPPLPHANGSAPQRRSAKPRNQRNGYSRNRFFDDLYDTD